MVVMTEEHGEKILPMAKHVWECHWCMNYISKKKEPNIYYDSLYEAHLYDPHHPEYSKMLQMQVCDACWYKSLYISVSSRAEEAIYGLMEQ